MCLHLVREYFLSLDFSIVLYLSLMCRAEICFVVYEHYSFLQYSAGYEPSKGRLNKPTSYIAKTNDIGQWIQVDLGKVAKVTRIGTQGRYNVGQWVTKFIVSYSIDGGYFQFQMHKSYNFPRVSCKPVSFLNLHNFFKKWRTSLTQKITDDFPYMFFLACLSFLVFPGPIEGVSSLP